MPSNCACEGVGKNCKLFTMGVSGGVKSMSEASELDHSCADALKFINDASYHFVSSI